MKQSKLGQGMFAVAFILGIAMLTMFFGEVEKRQHNPNQNPDSVSTDQLIEVNLQRNRQGHYVVSGTINNRPVEFLLDTGATDVVVPAALADRLMLKRGRPGMAMTANGSVKIYATSIDQLKIGDIVLYNVKASINPGMAPPSILLGMSALGRIEFIQSGDSLTLRQGSY
ncbi:MAG: TIGR02281 family clan AA aspartic protease [Pseudomonadales bacterium]|jgi:aspartyl protease family protein